MYAVIFISQHSNITEGYAEMAQQMEELVKDMPGYVGIDSVRNESGLGITISYWKSLENIKSWKENIEHKKAQKSGKVKWYKNYKIKICKVEHEYDYH
jgi:heme-degrading monooxygenase HmoA